MHPSERSLSNPKPWVPNPRLPHAFQTVEPLYYRSVHHQVFTLGCGLCGRRRRARIHLAAEENDSPRWPL